MASLVDRYLTEAGSAAHGLRPGRRLPRGTASLSPEAVAGALLRHGVFTTGEAVTLARHMTGRAVRVPPQVGARHAAPDFGTFAEWLFGAVPGRVPLLNNPLYEPPAPPDTMSLTEQAAALAATAAAHPPMDLGASDSEAETEEEEEEEDGFDELLGAPTAADLLSQKQHALAAAMPPPEQRPAWLTAVLLEEATEYMGPPEEASVYALWLRRDGTWPRDPRPVALEQWAAQNATRLAELRRRAAALAPRLEEMQTRYATEGGPREEAEALAAYVRGAADQPSLPRSASAAEADGMVEWAAAGLLRGAYLRAMAEEEKTERDPALDRWLAARKNLKRSLQDGRGEIERRLAKRSRSGGDGGEMSDLSRSLRRILLEQGYRHRGGRAVFLTPMLRAGPRTQRYEARRLWRDWEAMSDEEKQAMTAEHAQIMQSWHDSLRASLENGGIKRDLARMLEAYKNGAQGKRVPIYEAELHHAHYRRMNAELGAPRAWRAAMLAHKMGARHFTLARQRELERKRGLVEDVQPPDLDKLKNSETKPLRAKQIFLHRAALLRELVTQLDAQLGFAPLSQSWSVRRGLVRLERAKAVPLAEAARTVTVTAASGLSPHYRWVSLHGGWASLGDYNQALAVDRDGRVHRWENYRLLLRGTLSSPPALVLHPRVGRKFLVVSPGLDGASRVQPHEGAPHSFRPTYTIAPVLTGGISIGTRVMQRTGTVVRAEVDPVSLALQVSGTTSEAPAHLFMDAVFQLGPDTQLSASSQGCTPLEDDQPVLSNDAMRRYSVTTLGLAARLYAAFIRFQWRASGMPAEGAIAKRLEIPDRSGAPHKISRRPSTQVQLFGTPRPTQALLARVCNGVYKLGVVPGQAHDELLLTLAPKYVEDYRDAAMWASDDQTRVAVSCRAYGLLHVFAYHEGDESSLEHLMSVRFEQPSDASTNASAVLAPRQQDLGAVSFDTMHNQMGVLVERDGHPQVLVFDVPQPKARVSEEVAALPELPPLPALPMVPGADDLPSLPLFSAQADEAAEHVTWQEMQQLAPELANQLLGELDAF